MQEIALYPLKLAPALQVKVWGGRRLESALGKRLPSAEPYGEAWESHDSALVLNGPLAGMSLGELTARYGESLIGAGNAPEDGFPLLAKLIDAEDWLSVQVHPNDAQARALEGEPRGKTEAWVILHAEPGARLVIGLQPGTTRDHLRQAIRENRLEQLLAFREVRSGDALYIPANTAHALGPGLLLYEIQQSSDLTYRLYDWGRLGLDGLPRQLHIDRGAGVVNLGASPSVERRTGSLLIDGAYFQLWRHALQDGGLEQNGDRKFHLLTCIDGALSLEAGGHETLELKLGETCLIPACVERFRIAGCGTVLRACQP